MGYPSIGLGRDSWQFAINGGDKTSREVKVSRKDFEAGKGEFVTEVATGRVPSASTPKRHTVLQSAP